MGNNGRDGGVYVGALVDLRLSMPARSIKILHIDTGDIDGHQVDGARMARRRRRRRDDTQDREALLRQPLGGTELLMHSSPMKSTFACVARKAWASAAPCALVLISPAITPMRARPSQAPKNSGRFSIITAPTSPS